MTAPTNDLLAQEFVQFPVGAGVLRFGAFKTKAGRQSPAFFSTGFFDDGAKLMRPGEFYAPRPLANTRDPAPGASRQAATACRARCDIHV